MRRVRPYNNPAEGRGNAEHQCKLQSARNCRSERLKCLAALCKLQTDRTVLTRTIMICVYNQKGR
ncbi:MAG: hypothetical protein K5705_13945 [Oscillospiraceae bacterium]|nr:hypothetical protein [Oscillospiraceae bacterium]